MAVMVCFRLSRVWPPCGDPVLIPGSGRIPWRRKWQPTPVFLPGKPHERRSLVGYSPWGLKESDTTEQLHFLSLSTSRFFPKWQSRLCPGMTFHLNVWMRECLLSNSLTWLLARCNFSTLLDEGIHFLTNHWLVSPSVPCYRGFLCQLMFIWVSKHGDKRRGR